MSEGSSESHYSPLGDYDPPIEFEIPPKISKWSTPFYPFVASGSRSDESDGEESPLKAKINFFEHYNIPYQNFEIGSDDAKVFDFDKTMISEDEKKRLKNTEAARRCREKIKKRTEELEGDLSVYMSKNNEMDQQRIRLLSQIEEQIRMLDIMKSRNPHMATEITVEARSIVDKYKSSVASKRKALAEYYAKSSSRNY